MLLPVVLKVVGRHRERHRVVRHGARLLVPKEVLTDVSKKFKDKLRDPAL